jgi:hypothetical protein
MCLLRFKNNFLSIYCVRFPSKIICLMSDVFASLWKQFSYYRTCSLRFENNFYFIEFVPFASKIICLLSKVFASLRYRRKHHYWSYAASSECLRLYPFLWPSLLCCSLLRPSLLCCFLECPTTAVLSYGPPYSAASYSFCASYCT